MFNIATQMRTDGTECQHLILNPSQPRRTDWLVGEHVPGVDQVVSNRVPNGSAVGRQSVENEVGLDESIAITAVAFPNEWIEKEQSADRRW